MTITPPNNHALARMPTPQPASALLLLLLPARAPSHHNHHYSRPAALIYCPGSRNRRGGSRIGRGIKAMGRAERGLLVSKIEQRLGAEETTKHTVRHNFYLGNTPSDKCNRAALSRLPILPRHSNRPSHCTCARGGLVADTARASGAGREADGEKGYECTRSACDGTSLHVRC